ncbi:hypothetical protein TRICI_006190 [Trichomonascus ciferrii]|uniref:Uncharacterized protein n=1 Tax=Trichomonascus ciferrii TaxID=44093 RepID=A0A642UK65_9ASCO|nr:hypothetical protein TRICI_006190 [Trichomonascus ciferrii]
MGSVLFFPIGLWQANYSKEVESGKQYRQIVKKARCTVYVKRLRLFDVMKTRSRYVISKLVQFRTGHALVGGWFKERGIQRDEGYNCGCGELETIQHIIQQCPKRAEERKKLKKVSPNLELPILLNTKKGLQAMAEFSMTGRKHDTAKLEVRQINQPSSRQLEATQATSQQADSSESGSD